MPPPAPVSRLRAVLQLGVLAGAGVCIFVMELLVDECPLWHAALIAVSMTLTIAVWTWLQTRWASRRRDVYHTAAIDELHRSHDFVQRALDSLSAHIAIIDASGIIADVNETWRHTTSGDGYVGAGLGVGEDFLTACNAAAQLTAIDPAAAEAARAVQDLLAGRRDHAEVESSCSGPHGRRWFVSRYSRFVSAGRTYVVVAHEDATERQRAVQERLAAEAKLQQLLAHSPAIVYASAASDCYDFTFVSANVRGQFGFTPAQAAEPGFWLGRVHPDDRGSVRAAMEQLAIRGNVVHEYRLQRQDGAWRWVHDALAVLPATGEEEPRVVGCCLDVTDRKRAEDAARECNSLREAVQALEQVMAVIGHELRTPLASLRAMSELLIDDGFRAGPESGPLLGSIHGEIVRMSDVVNNMLDAAQLQGGSGNWQWETVRLADACREGIEAVRPMLRDPLRVELTMGIEPDDLEIQSNPEAIQRLVQHLVSNACKHTAEGSIRVEAKRVRRSNRPEEQWIELVVRDTGEGMSPEVLARLGQPFAINAGTIGTNFTAGSGFGVAICRGIASAHGGQLLIASTPRGGTTVQVLLRADLPAPINREPEARAIAINHGGAV